MTDAWTDGHTHTYTYRIASVLLVSCSSSWSLRCSAVTAMSKLENKEIHHSLYEIGFYCFVHICCCLYASLSFVFTISQCKWRMSNLVKELKSVCVCALFFFVSFDLKVNNVLAFSLALSSIVHSFCILFRFL